jgi:hypothetical protein
VPFPKAFDSAREQAAAATAALQFRCPNPNIPNIYPNQGARLQTASHLSSEMGLFALNYSLSIVFIGLQVGRGWTSEVQLLLVYDPMSLERVLRPTQPI